MRFWSRLCEWNTVSTLFLNEVYNKRRRCYSSRCKCCVRRIKRNKKAPDPDGILNSELAHVVGISSRLWTRCFILYLESDKFLIEWKTAGWSFYISRINLTNCLPCTGLLLNKYNGQIVWEENIIKSLANLIQELPCGKSIQGW